MAELGLSPEVSPGTYLAKVYLRRTSGELEVHRLSFFVSPHAFPHQSLRLSQKMSKKYDLPSAQKERALIGQALRTESPWLLGRPPFHLPCRGRVSTLYGTRRVVNGKKRGAHRGVDLACGSRAKIRAPAAGKVLLAEPSFQLHGKTVLLDHGEGLVSLYLHLSQILVRVGERVRAGDPLGKVGSTGVATGPHLHWGVTLHGVPIDPLRLL